MFKQIAEAADYHFREMTRYESYLKHYRDLKNVVATARMEGRQRGLEEGREEALKISFPLEHRNERN